MVLDNFDFLKEDIVRRIPFIFFAFGPFLGFHCFSQTILSDDFIIGADLSMAKAIIDQSGVYKYEDQPVDLFHTLATKNFNYTRVRLFHTPNGEEGTVNTLDYTLELARSIKDAGQKLLLDFHYSDWWADPSQQTKPQAWVDLDFQILNDSVYHYTKSVLDRFKAEGIKPDLVQTGNEINHGFLWPDGATWNNSTPNWKKFTTLLKSAIRGVKESNGGAEIPVLIHGVYSTDSVAAQAYLDSLEKYEVPIEVIGLSYYQCWDGSLASLEVNLSFLQENYPYDIILAETSYPADGSLPDWCALDESEIPYPLSEVGQYDYLQNLYHLFTFFPSVKGLFYWGGELIWAGNVDGSYESLFHWQGNARLGLDAFVDLVQNIEPIQDVSTEYKIYRSGINKITIESPSYENSFYYMYDLSGRLILTGQLDEQKSIIHLQRYCIQPFLINIFNNKKNTFYSIIIK